MRSGFALAAKAIIVDGDKVLLLRRSEKEMKTSILYKDEIWDLPGGSIRFHENCINGLMREISEETSIKAQIIKPIRVFDVIKNRIHMTICIFLCTYEYGVIKLSDEHDAYYWLNLKEAEEVGVPIWMLKDIQRAVSELKE